MRKNPDHAAAMPGTPIAAAGGRRAVVSADIWDFQDFGSWRGAAWDISSGFLGAACQDAFLMNPPEYVVGDDLSWLDAIVARTIGRNIDTKASMAEALRVRYRAIRAYHGTSVADGGSFMRHGLLPLDVTVQQQRARDFFIGADYPEITELVLLEAFRLVGPELREGRTFFEANERLLVDRCGHYMLYGSEYLLAVAASLPGRHDYRQALKGTGKPTVFSCDVPLVSVRQATLLEFAGMALEFIFEDLLAAPGGGLPAHRGAGFSIRVPLEPGCIVGYYHPARVHDPIAPYR